MPVNRGLLSPSLELKGKPVPGGKSQAGQKRNPSPGHSVLGAYAVNVGQRRGEVGKSTADIRGRSLRQQQAMGRKSGNYGGGWANILGQNNRGLGRG